jgi:hypothetical protein
VTLPGNLKKIAACLLVGVILSIISRTDVNWDLQNYHLYGPFSVLNGRIGADYFAAGFQGYLNPLVDLPYYIAKFIVFSKHPVVVAGLAGLPFGLLAYIVWRIARVLLPDGNAWEPAITAVLGLTGAITLSEVGTTLDDVTVADVVLSGLLCALTEWKCLPSAAALSGLAVGCATGLKLTAFLFAPGVLLICLLQTAGLRQILLVISLFCVALGIGFLTTWGWWGYLLWRQFQNPLFPMFASIFPSPWSQGIMSRGVV